MLYNVRPPEFLVMVAKASKEAAALPYVQKEAEEAFREALVHLRKLHSGRGCLRSREDEVAPLASLMAVSVLCLRAVEHFELLGWRGPNRVPATSMFLVGCNIPSGPSS